MKKVIVIGGPTGSGKTDLAIRIAQYYQTEIISADSRQCYRELNIGVAKPSPDQLAAVQHHFINSHSIHEELSAALFEQYALEKANKLFEFHDVIVCVGGTGMYLKAFCEGLDEMPPVDPTIVTDIEHKYKQYGIDWLRTQIKERDPDFSATPSEIQNPARLLRALSFLLSNGKPIRHYQQGIRKERPFQIIPFVLDIDREVLYQRINRRVDQMIQDGLIDEAKTLFPHRHLKSLNTVGYQEVFDYLDGRFDLEECIRKIKQHTRHYAKRQLTWFKHNADSEWLSADELYLNSLNIN